MRGSREASRLSTSPKFTQLCMHVCPSGALSSTHELSRGMHMISRPEKRSATALDGRERSGATMNRGRRLLARRLADDGFDETEAPPSN